MSGLGFVAMLMKAFGLLGLLSGCAVAFLGGGRGGTFSPFGDWLDRRWRSLDATGWAEVPRAMTQGMWMALAGLLKRCFVEADKSALFGAVFIGLVFVFVPLASAINWAVGGSPFLALYIFSAAAALAVLNFTGEIRRLSLVNGALSLILGVSFLLFVPAYVLRSFTDRLLNEVVGHAALVSFPVAALVFIVAYSAMIVFDAFFPDGPGPGFHLSRAAVHAFLAALPVAFVLTFMAQLTGHFAVSYPVPLRSLRLLMASMFFVSLAFSATLVLMRAAIVSPGPAALAGSYAAALAAGAGLSWSVLYFGYLATASELTPAETLNVLAGLSADGARVYLGPDFWIMHLAFLPFLAFLGAVLLGGLAKAARLPFLGAPGPAAAKARLSAGLFLAVLGALVLAAGVSL